jgi:hypothetical protein
MTIARTEEPSNLVANLGELKISDPEEDDGFLALTFHF